MSGIRLGDNIDDHCSRCRRLTDHDVVALHDAAIRKVRCRTCQHEHEYRHGKGGKKKKSAQSAYEQVLASIVAPFPGPPPAAAPLHPKAARARRGLAPGESK